MKLQERMPDNRPKGAEKALRRLCKGGELRPRAYIPLVKKLSEEEKRAFRAEWDARNRGPDKGGEEPDRPDE